MTTRNQARAMLSRMRAIQTQSNIVILQKCVALEENSLGSDVASSIRTR